MKKKLIVLGLIAIIPLLLVNTIPNAQGQVDLGQTGIKVVVEFEYPFGLGKLNNDYNQDLAPVIDTIAIDFGADYTSFSHFVKLKVQDFGKNETSGNNQYQVYPKVVLSGSNSTKTIADFNEEFNTTIALIRIAIIDFLLDNGGTNVSTHIHFTFGSLDIDEGF